MEIGVEVGLHTTLTIPWLRGDIVRHKFISKNSLSCVEADQALVARERHWAERKVLQLEARLA